MPQGAGGRRRCCCHPGPVLGGKGGSSVHGSAGGQRRAPLDSLCPRPQRQPVVELPASMDLPTPPPLLKRPTLPSGGSGSSGWPPALLPAQGPDRSRSRCAAGGGHLAGNSGEAVHAKRWDKQAGVTMVTGEQQGGQVWEGSLSEQLDRCHPLGTALGRWTQSALILTSLPPTSPCPRGSHCPHRMPGNGLGRL